MNLWEIIDLPYGKERRKEILNFLDRSDRIPFYVNCKYRPQIHQDKDLKYLLKKKIIKTIRVPHGCITKRTCVERNLNG